MIQRFTYLGSVTIEHVKDGDSESWNVYPLEPEPKSLPPESVELPAAPALLLPPDPALVAAPLEMCAPAPAPTLKRRGLMGVIRATKTILFTVGGEALVYAANNLAGLNLPPGLGLVVGATAYGVQKAIKPDGLL